jgi:two-component system NarL family response regulator
MSVNVFLVDPDVFHRRGISCFLAEAPQLRVIGEATTLVSALPQLRNDTVDVTLVTSRDAFQADCRAVRQIVSGNPRNKVLVAWESPKIREVGQLFDAGVSGCIALDRSEHGLVGAILSVSNGRTRLMSHLTSEVLEHFRLAGHNAEPNPESVGLTSRERRIIRYVSKGLNNKQIAELLILSEIWPRSFVCPADRRLTV